MYCTSIRQSKHLIELGIDPKTADMWHSITYGMVIADRPFDGSGQPDGEFVPAWSLGALLTIVPEDEFYLAKFKNLYRWMTMSGASASFKEPIDTIYDYLVYQLEK